MQIGKDAHARAFVWLEDNSVKSVPAFHLLMGSGDQTEATRHAKQVPLGLSQPTRPINRILMGTSGSCYLNLLITFSVSHSGTPCPYVSPDKIQCEVDKFTSEMFFLRSPDLHRSHTIRSGSQDCQILSPKPPCVRFSCFK